MSDSVSEDHVLDGNMLAGPLSEIFAVDATIAVGQCADCGWTGPLAETKVYMGAGAVARCPRCGQVLLVVVSSPDEVRLDLRGLANLRIQTQGQKTPQ